MSDSFPPIPPTSSGGSVPPPPMGGPYLPPQQSAPPPPPQFGQPQFGQPQYGPGGIPQYTAPAGYTPYGAPMSAPLQQTAGTRKAMVVLFWATTAACALLGLMAYRRGGVFEDFVNGSTDFDAIDNADATVGLALLAMAGLQIAAAIVLAVWSNRTTSNAKARGADVSTGLAAGGWFIPIGNYWVPWSQLAKATRHFGSAPSSLRTWQFLFLGQAVLSIVARGAGNVETISATDGSDVIDKLHRQGLLFLGTAVLLAITTVVAAKATREIDQITGPG